MDEIKLPARRAPRDVSRSCFVSLHVYTVDIDGIARAVHRGVFHAGFKPSMVADGSHVTSIRDTVIGEIARADCVLADVTDSSPHTFFELGLAQAMGKPVLLLVRSEDAVIRCADVRSFAIIAYEHSPRGLIELAARIQSSLEELHGAPERASAPTLPRLARRFAVDWRALQRGAAEELCRDLLARMGLQRLAWTRDEREIDLTAELSRRDPDGLEFRELWLVAMGRRASAKTVVDAFAKDPGRLLRCLPRRAESEGGRCASDDEATVTLLVILLRDQPAELERLQHRLKRHFERAREHGREHMRIRVWDRQYLTALVQQFPELGYKYFGSLDSSEAKVRGSGGIGDEHDALAEKLAIAETELAAERNRRVRLERDAIWKEISFTALHQIVNPVFAIETFLDPLERRIREARSDEARQVVGNIRAAVEKAKSIIEQFKALARAQRIDTRPLLLLPLLEESCRDARELGHACTITCPVDLRVVGDPERLGECFRGLVASGADAVGPQVRHIAVEATLLGAAIPDGLDSEHDYVLVRIKDRGNGDGAVVGDKRRISEVCFTNGDHRRGNGLSLARRIVEAHGGVMLEAGAPPEGAELDVYLRVASERGEEAKPMVAEATRLGGA